MKLNSIQVLRALAVVLVTHIHGMRLQRQFGVSFQQHFYRLDDFGAIGVDLFFVISGFIISYVAGHYIGYKDGGEFLKKRFLRINPIYYLASMIHFVILCLIGSEFTLDVLFIRFLNSLTILPLFAIQIQPFMPILNVGWSLSVEWLFYLLFFLTILTGIKNKLIGLVIIIGVLVTFGRFYHPDFWFAFYTHPLLLEFLLGVGIHYIYKRVQVGQAVAFVLFFIGIGGYIFNIFYDYKNFAKLGDVMMAVDQINRVLLWGIPSAFLFAGSVFLGKAGVWNKLWNNSFVLLLGDASYSIYLIHIIVNYMLYALYRQVGFFLNPDLSIFLHMVAGIAAGVLFYKKVERPVIAYFHAPKQKLPA